MSKLKFSIEQMFLYLDILREDEAAARKSGNQRKLDAVHLRIDSIKIMLDTALFNTVEEQAPYLKINTDMFDMKALSKVLPGLNMSNLPRELEIDFSDSVVVVENKDPKSFLAEMLSTNFVKKIQEAVDGYLQVTGKEMMPADAWIEIKSLLQDHPLIPRWDLHIANTFEEKGPLAAFAQIKKNLPTWGTGEISRVMEDAVRRTIINPKTPFSKAKYLEELIANPFPRANLLAWAGNVDCLTPVADYVRIGDANLITAMMDPHKRGKIEGGLGRKPYVEKGY